MRSASFVDLAALDLLSLRPPSHRRALTSTRLAYRLIRLRTQSRLAPSSPKFFTRCSLQWYAFALVLRRTTPAYDALSTSPTSFQLSSWES